jgi:hypothetical protein
VTAGPHHPNRPFFFPRISGLYLSFQILGPNKLALRRLRLALSAIGLVKERVPPFPFPCLVDSPAQG